MTGLMPKVKVRYRADRRLQVVEIRSGEIAFLTPLSTFENLVGVDTSDLLCRKGTVGVWAVDYRTLFACRIKKEE